jgi:hypothetical protein
MNDLVKVEIYSAGESGSIKFLIADFHRLVILAEFEKWHLLCTWSYQIFRPSE